MKTFSPFLFFACSCLLLIAFLSACMPATQPPNSPTPSLLPTVVVISVLETSTPALPPPEEIFYENETYGFRLQIPEGYEVEELPLRNGMLLSLGFAFESKEQTQRYGFPLGLTVYEKPNEIPLLEWFSTHIGGLNEASQPTSDEVFFYEPLIENQNAFKGNPALQYESGMRPIPYEIVIDRGVWAIGFYYLRDYPNDYQPMYDQILTSLEFFDPIGGQTANPTLLPPTATPTVCLDESAQPRVLPPRETPLEVRFISDGNVWVWEETSGSAQQISDTRDAQTFSFSPDGQSITFMRGPLYEQTELWGINRDGTNLRLLVSADQLHTLAGEPSITEHTYLDTLRYIYWIEGTSHIGFAIDRSYNAIGGCCDFGGYWQVDVVNGEITSWVPPEELVAIPNGLLSPDASQKALIHNTTMSLVNADGSNLREDVFSFLTTPVHEGGGTIYPQIDWAQDSQSLLAITFSGDIYDDNTTFSTWHIPIDGSPAQELHTFVAPYYWANLSPNQKYLAYVKRVQPMTNDHELYLATFDGSIDIPYFAQYGAEFLHWHPDSYHFVYDQWNISRPFLGSVCGGSMPLLDPVDTPATQIQWVDATRFLYVKGPNNSWAGPRELRLGQIGGPSILIGPFNGDYAQYFFNVEGALLEQE